MSNIGVKNSREGEVKRKGRHHPISILIFLQYNFNISSIITINEGVKTAKWQRSSFRREISITEDMSVFHYLLFVYLKIVESSFIQMLCLSHKTFYPDVINELPSEYINVQMLMQITLI